MNLVKRNNRIILSSCGYIPKNSSAFYNYKNGVINMSQSCICGSDVEYLEQTTSQAAEYNFEIYKGSTLDFDVVYKDASKVPVNLTGYKCRCIAQYDNKTFTINTEICDAVSGKIHLFMSSYETSNIYTLDYRYTNVTEYTYQLELISPSKKVYRIMEGKICVKPAAGSC